MFLSILSSVKDTVRSQEASFPSSPTARSGRGGCNYAALVAAAAEKTVMTTTTTKTAMLPASLLKNCPQNGAAACVGPSRYQDLDVRMQNAGSAKLGQSAHCAAMRSSIQQLGWRSIFTEARHHLRCTYLEMGNRIRRRFTRNPTLATLAGQERASVIKWVCGDKYSYQPRLFCRISATSMASKYSFVSYSKRYRKEVRVTC